MNRKPALAEDAILEKMVFPKWAQPKIDGVRALNRTGQLTGRSLDPFKGFGVTDYFSKPDFIGFDGEMTLGSNPASTERLCSLTTGAMGRFKGVTEMPDLHWWIFDFVTEETFSMPYSARYNRAANRVAALQHPRIHIVPFGVVGTMSEAQAIIGDHLEAGYEGTIWRNPNAPHKEGRSDKNQQLWRSKPWADFEILVTRVEEGSKNTNEAKINSLGRTERSFAQEGLVPNGMIGSIYGTLLADVFDHGGRLLFSKSMEVKAGPGEMTDEEALAWFKDQSKIVGHIAKIKHMTHGVKDKPRFPTFVSKRLPQDMSN
jgi:DNA ligase-1